MIYLNSRPYVWVMTAEYAPAIIGGLGTVATQLTRSLASSQVKVDVITVGKSKVTHIYNNQHIKIVRIPMNSRYVNVTTNTFKPSVIQRVTAKFLPRKPDLIHVHSLEFAQVALFYKRKYNIPIVYTCHSLVAMERKSRIGRVKHQAQLIRQANAVVVPSTWLKGQILRRLKGVASKINVIPNGVRAVTNGTNSPPYKLLFVGRLVRKKGIESLIRALPLLAKKDTRVQLSVVGKGTPYYIQRLKAMARNRGVAKRIKWLGALPHSSVQQLYAKYGAVVVPSKEESFCLVALEAMANGIPLVSSRAGGLKEFVNDSNAQIIHSVKGVTISKAIIAMWQSPSAVRRRVMAGRLVAQRNNWSQMAARYNKLYERAVYS